MLQLHNAELEGELDRVREEANRQISELEAGNQEQALAAQQQGQELQARRREVATLEAKLHSRSGVLAGHSERAKQLQQVCCAMCAHEHCIGNHTVLQHDESR